MALSTITCDVVASFPSAREVNEKERARKGLGTKVICHAQL